MKFNKNKWIMLVIFFVSSIVLTVIDQISKIAAVNHLKDKSAIPVIKDVFELYYLENTGTAWGLFGGAINAFLIITVFILAIVIFIIIKMPVSKKYIPLWIDLILITSGAVGNFIDRLTLNYVRDFLYFKLINFPVFNIADSYVVIGIIIFAYLVLFTYKDDDFDFVFKNKKM